MAAVAMAALAFEERITRDARRFDLKPLLQLLHDHGYEREDVLFESVHEASSSSIVDSVEFSVRPHRGVLVSVNVGLLGDNSLLPSYFLQVLERSDHPERFFDFIRFFDHRLIENYVRSVYPEDDPGIYRDWAQVQRSFFKMLGLGSVSTLQWLWKLYFPELRVKVTRRAFANATETHAFRTGQSTLDGTGVLGRVYESDATGFVVDLFAEEEIDGHGRPWPELIEARLNRSLMPLMSAYRIPLVVRLRVLFHSTWARMDFPFADEHGYLGYARIRGDVEEGHTIVIYRGITGEQTDT